MNFRKSLLSQSTTILQGWFDLVLDAYPDEAARVLRKKTDPFQNPMGHQLSKTLEGLFDVVTEARPVSDIEGQLDDFIRIRAIQDLTVGSAVSFVFDLKNVVRDVLAEDIFAGEPGFIRDLLLFESRVDDAATAVFEAYARVREKLIRLRTREVKKNTYRLLQQAGVIREITDPDADITRMPSG